MRSSHALRWGTDVASQHPPVICVCVGRGLFLQGSRVIPNTGSAAGACEGRSHSTTTGNKAFKRRKKNLSAQGLWLSLPTHQAGVETVPLKLLKNEECCLLGWVFLLPHPSGCPGVKASFPICDLVLIHDGKLNIVMAIVVMSTSVQRTKQHWCYAKQSIHLTKTQAQAYSVTKHLLCMKIN